MSTSLYILWLLFICQTIVSSVNADEGVLEKLKNGLNYAKNYLDKAKEIADLVSKSLNQQNNEKRGDDGVKHDEPSKHHDSGKLASAFFRLLGLDSPKIAAIAVNSAIFLAQMISMLFVNNNKKDKARAIDMDDEIFDPLEFITKTKNERIENLLKQAHDPRLADQLIERLDGPDSGCIKLLMCKLSPIIVNAQESLKNKNVKQFDIVTWLPTKQVFERNGDNCEDKHVDCRLFPDD